MSINREDVKLAKQLARGNEAAFKQFFDAHFARLYRFAMHRLDQDHDLARDIAQQTLCVAIDKIADYRGEAALYTWMCQIARNLIMAHHRKNQRQMKKVVPIGDVPEIRRVLEAVAMSEELQPEKQYAQARLRTLITEVLDCLPGQYGDVLEWKYVEHLSVEQIAERMDTTMVAVQSILARARNAFKGAMGRLLKEAPEILGPEGV